VQKLRIGVNLLYLRPGRVGGSETYVRAVLKEMPRLTDKVEFQVFGSRECIDTFTPSTSFQLQAVHEKPFNQISRLWYENVCLGKWVSNLDLLWSPTNFIAPGLPKKTRQVATIYDLQHRWYPQNFSVFQCLIRELLFQFTFQQAISWMAISEFSRRDALQRYNADPARSHSVLLGADFPQKPTSEQTSEILKKYNLLDPYFYFPATMAPHKGHAFLLDAYAKAARKADAKIPKLVLTGQKGKIWPSISQKIKELGLSDSVTHLGYVPRNDVVALLSEATAMLFPSRFEGFGLPVLEAMSLNTPVLASRNTAIQEVAGKGAWLLDTYDHEEWATAMVQISRDASLRKEWIQKGLKNNQRFSWEKCARETLKILVQSSSKPNLMVI